MKLNDETLNQAQIDEWKKLHGKIYSTTVEDTVIIWRPLRRNEYVEIMVNATEDDSVRRILMRQEQILKTACLYPANIDEIIDEQGGIASGISAEIMAKSGFGETVTKEL